MRYLGLCLVLAVLSGCVSYSQGFQKVELLLIQQKPELALVEHEKSVGSSKNELLYLMDKAMLQRMNGQFEASNATLEAAKKVMDELDATSVSEQTTSFLINDSSMSYEGEDYEQIAVHLYAALNYIELNLWDEARVEALQIDQRLKKFAEKHEGKTIDDAFSRYLTGLIYEHGKEWSDAMIAYRMAYQAYQKEQQPIPIFLKQDLIRLSQYLGLKDEYKQYKKDFNLEHVSTLQSMKQQGEVVLLLHHGLAPIKQEQSILVIGNKGVQHRVSLPIYRSRPSYISRARLTVGDVSVDSQVVEDFDMLARKSFDTHKPAMIARLIARAILKQAIAKEVKSKNGDLAGLITNVAGMVTETADTRSWLTLPKNIHLSRLMLEPGIYPASLTLLGRNGEVISSKNLQDITVVKGEKVVIEQSYIAPYREK